MKFISGNRLAVDGKPGNNTSNAFQKVFGRYLAKDPRGTGEVSSALIYHSSNELPKAKELQKFLNQISPFKLVEDGKPGHKTSDAFRTVFGFPLSGDPRK